MTPSKNDLRTLGRTARRALSVDSRRDQSEKVCLHVSLSPEFARARSIHMYWPLEHQGELDTRPLMNEAWRLDKQVWLPVIRGNVLLCAPLTNNASMKAGPFGTLEPETPPADTAPSLDLVVIPALLFDEQGGRLGYGGGFYDRFLEQTDGFRIVVGFREQLHPDVPMDQHDIPMQALCTPDGIRYIP